MVKRGSEERRVGGFIILVVGDDDKWILLKYADGQSPSLRCSSLENFITATYLIYFFLVTCAEQTRGSNDDVSTRTRTLRNLGLEGIIINARKHGSVWDVPRGAGMRLAHSRSRTAFGIR